MANTWDSYPADFNQLDGAGSIAAEVPTDGRHWETLSLDGFQLDDQGTTSPGLKDYLEVVTPQGARLYPVIISSETSKVSFEYGLVSKGSFYVDEQVPADSICRLILNYNQVVFAGLCKQCRKKLHGFWLVDCYGPEEILKPSSPAGGYTLGKYIWETIQVQTLLSDLKPSLNSNKLGLIYMMNSLVDPEFFKSHDVTSHVYKIPYTGRVLNIPEIFEDVALLTKRSALTDLITPTDPTTGEPVVDEIDRSGWYHDETAKVLYLRCTDDTRPYYHLITIPGFCDGMVPIRLGIIEDHAATTLTYWETAYGDVPYDNLKLLLDCLGLEFSTRYAGGVCYIDIAESCGNGSPNYPAQTYVENANITGVSEIVLEDARYQINAPVIRGYGAGTSGIQAGLFLNDGRGKRLVRLDDPSLHSNSAAALYIQNYLDEHQLPDHRITFETPIYNGPSIELRHVGDTLRIELDSEHFLQTLRAQIVEYQIGSKSVISITAGDHLITIDQILAAMKSAAEKDRKHREDTLLSFDDRWDTNLDSSLPRTHEFEVLEDVLKVQALEISINTSKAVHESPVSQAGGGGGGGGGSTGGAGGGSGSTCAVAAPGHGHSAEAGVGVADSSTSAAHESHVHGPGSLQAEPSTGSISVVTDVVPATDCCTAASCGHEWIEEIDVTKGAASPVSHHHTIRGFTDVPIGIVQVAMAVHSHSVYVLVGTSSESVSVPTMDHTHEVTLDEVPDHDNPYVKTKASGSSVPKEVSGWSEDNMVPAVFSYEASRGSDPDEYLAVTISGPGLTGKVPLEGSPYVVSNTEPSVGPVILSELVKVPGKYTLEATLSNKTTPGEACSCRMGAQITGKFFVDTIIADSGVS